jgi:rhamnose transport system permease protein
VATEVAVRPPGAGLGVRVAQAVARQRELSLVGVMALLAAFVTIQAPVFVSAHNLTQVSVLASIIAIVAVGQTLVIITRNVDLSVESTMGVVAFVVADILQMRLLDPPAAWLVGVGLGLLLGAVNGFLVAGLKVPAIVATLGTLSIYRGLAFLIAGGEQVSVGALPERYTAAARETFLGIPLFVLLAIAIVAVVAFALRSTRAGRQVYAVGSNPEAAAILGIRSGRVVFGVFTVCGLLAGIAGVLWGINYGTINAAAATGVTLQVVAAVVVGGVSINGGSGTVLGAALGALFLGLISNALIVLRLSPFWLQAIFGAVILAAVSLDAFILRRLRRARAGRPQR